MEIRIEKASSSGEYNLYVNGSIAVSHETMQVCDNVKEALMFPLRRGYYSEAAEIADSIRRALNV